MDEIEMIRKITTLMYSYRHEAHCKSMQKDKVRHRDMMVLDAIVKKENHIKMSDLSSHFSITKAAISQEIKRLEELGWIEREKETTDKRAVYLCVTPLGIQTLALQQKKVKAKFVEFFDELGEEDTQALFRILEKGLEFYKKGESIC